MASSLEGPGGKNDETKNQKTVIYGLLILFFVVFVFLGCLCIAIFSSSLYHEAAEWDSFWQGVIIVLALGLSVGMIFHGLPFQFKIIRHGDSIEGVAFEEE